jgi:stearoyl-CoA desaturase (delta-9 desaturase)
MCDHLGGPIGRSNLDCNENLEIAHHELEELLRRVPLPAMPTMEDFRARAAAIFAGTPSMNDIVERGRQLLIDDVFDELLGRKPAPCAER